MSLSLASLFLAGAAFAEPGRLEIRGKQPLVLGDFNDVTVTLRLDEPNDGLLRPLQVSASAGSIESLRRVEPGLYEATFTPPKTRFPQVAIIAFWFETGPDAPIAFARIPLFARTKLPCKARPGASVEVAVGALKFGPIAADKKGSAAVPIVVPPGVREVKVLTGEKERAVPVKVPPYNRLAVAVTPHVVAPDPSAYATVHVYYDAELPPPASAIRLSVLRGDLKAISADGNHYKSKYVPEPAADKEITLNAQVDFDRNAKAQATIQLGSPQPDKIAITSAKSQPDPKGGIGNVFRVQVLDRFGLGVAGEKLEVQLNADVTPAIRDLSGGLYEVTVGPPPVPPPDGTLTVDVSVDSANGTITARAEAHGAKPAAPAASAETTAPETPAKTGVLFVGPRLGGTYEGTLSPFAGLDLGGYVGGGVAVFFRGAYRLTSQSFTVQALGNPSVSSTLVRVPLLGAVSYDILGGRYRLYLGIAAGASLLSQTISSDFQATQTYRRIVPTAQAFFGAAYGGFMLELGGNYMNASSAELAVPKLSGALSLGYRLEVL